MKKELYRRKRSVIFYLETDKQFNFLTVNKAKHESHLLQMKYDGALGRGTVRKV